MSPMKHFTNDQRDDRNRKSFMATRTAGFTLVELIGTCVILGSVFSIVVPMMLIVARERRSTEQRQFAMQHATNLLEDSTSLTWDKLSPGELSLPTASEDLIAVLPDLQRSLVVRQVENDLPARQIVATVRWRNTSGKMDSGVKLSSWVFGGEDQ